MAHIEDGNDSTAIAIRAIRAEERARVDAEVAPLLELAEWIVRVGQNVTKDQIITRAWEALGRTKGGDRG